MFKALRLYVPVSNGPIGKSAVILYKNMNGTSDAGYAFNDGQPKDYTYPVTIHNSLDNLIGCRSYKLSMLIFRTKCSLAEYHISYQFVMCLSHMVLGVLRSDCGKIIASVKI